MEPKLSKFPTRNIFPITHTQILLIVITVALVITILTFAHSVHAIPATLYVDQASGTGPPNNCQSKLNPCQKIQQAIDEAFDDDTILVAQGVYTEKLDIGKKITVQGGYNAADWQRDVDM